MSLCVNGLRIKKGKENELPKILELLKEPIIVSFQNKACEKAQEVACSFYNYYEKDLSDEFKNKDIVSFSNFFEKNIFGIRKKFLDPSFFNRTYNIDSFPLFLDALLTSDMYSYNQYEMEILKTKKTKRTMITLPSFLEQSSLPEKLFEYCDNYSTENQTDDIPAHFKVYADKEKANSEWYDTNKIKFHHSIKIPLKINKWLLEIKPRQLLTKINVAYKIYESEYLKSPDMAYHEKMDEILMLMEDADFIVSVNNEIENQEKMIVPKLESLKEKWGVSNV